MTDAPPPTPPADATPPPAAPTQQPYTAAAPAPAPKPVKPGSATTLIWRRRDRATLTGALTAVLIGWAIHLLFRVVYVIQDISYAIDDGIEWAIRGFGDFFFFGLWHALFFFGPAFLVLWLLLPIVKESPLSVVLKRAAAAGVAGLAGLIFFGLVDGIFDAVTEGGFYIGYFGVDLLWGPLAGALGYTLYLMLGATIAWLRSHRPPKPVAVVPAAAPAAAPAAPVAPAAPAAPAASTPPADPTPPAAPPAAPTP